MDFRSHAFRTGLVIGIPLLILLGLELFHRWLRKQDAEISATLQRRDEKRW
jgi:hypothetical protein